MLYNYLLVVTYCIMGDDNVYWYSRKQLTPKPPQSERPNRTAGGFMERHTAPRMNKCQKMTKISFAKRPTGSLTDATETILKTGSKAMTSLTIDSMQED